MKNSHYTVVGSLDTVPASALATGDITTDGAQVTGIATLFLSEVQVGDWLFDKITNNEIRRVTSIGSDTILYVDEAFSVDIAGAQAFRITRSVLTFIGIGIPAGATGFIDNTAVTEKTSMNWSSADNQSGVANIFVDPVVIEPTAGNFLITTLGK